MIVVSQLKDLINLPIIIIYIYINMVTLLTYGISLLGIVFCFLFLFKTKKAIVSQLT